LIGLIVRARARIAERRLDVLHELAKHGKLEGDALAELTRSHRRLVKGVLVVGWFALLGGAGLLIASLAWRREFYGYGGVGVAIMGGALAVISAPIMLREMRRLGVV
jgi:hypothetical protein